jgi:heterodisulfide reductase subunit C
MMSAENVPDNAWKSTLLEEVGESLNLCFQCGTCTSSCPSGRMTAFRTRQIIRKAQFGLPELILPTDDLWHCTTCFTCYERCPRGVEIVDVITALRNMAVRAGFMSDDHKNLVLNLYKTGHLVDLTDNIKELRGSMNLNEVPNTVLREEEYLEQIQFIMEQTRLMRIIKED